MVYTIIRNLYEGWYNSNASYFFSETKTSTTIKFIHAKCTSFKKLRLFFHKVSFTNSILFPPLHEILYAGHLKLFCEVLELITHPAFQLTVICKIASLECTLHRAKKMEVGGCKIRKMGRMRENSPPHCCNCLLVHRMMCGLALWCRMRTLIIFLVGQTHWICCSNFFHACTYHYELIVAPLSKNSTNKIPSLFQMTLAPDVMHRSLQQLEFFLHGNNRRCPSIDCLFVSGS